MLALCVDDERLPLEALVRAVGKSPDINGVKGFDDEIDALEWAKNNHIDIAFLDMELHEINGIELAEKLRDLHPNLSVVFCTGYEQYAVRAMNLHIDAGYLVKPFRAVQIQEEIDHIKNKRLAYTRPAAVNFLSQQKQEFMIRMMGEFSITVKGNEPVLISTKAKKGTAFLQYLILNEGQKIPKQRLIHLFWPDYLHANPDSALKVMVSRVRKGLHDISGELENCIVADGGAYYFKVLPGMTVDVLQIREICSRLDEETDPGKREKLFESLLHFYTADLFFNGDITGMEEYIADYRRNYISAVNEYSLYLQENGQFDKVIGICRKAELIDPFDEGLHMRIMLALKSSGQPDEAREEYEHVNRFFRKHLDTEPSEDFCRFYSEKILENN